jgi:oxygen-independent coproporphyrinogen III oxidase
MKYLGLGPSAHSFNGAERQWNISHNNQYITAINKGELPAEKEILTPIQQLNEYIMTSLRTMEGTNLGTVKKRFAVEEDELLSKAKKYLESGLMKKEENALVLTKEGKLLADGIAARLFF